MTKLAARRQPEGATVCGNILAELRENPLPADGRQLDADELVAAAAALAKAGGHLRDGDSDDDHNWPALAAEYKEYAAAFTGYLQNDCSLPLLAGIRERHKLNGEELEILCVCAASAVGALESSLRDVERLQAYFPAFRRTGMKTARLLLPESRLVMSGLIQLDEDTPFRDSRIAVDPRFVEAALRGKEAISSAWNCSTQEELLKKLPLLRRMVNNSAENLEDGADDESSPVRREKRELDRFVKLFLGCVEPGWPLAEIFSKDMYREEEIILIALLADAALGSSRPAHPWSSDEECCGESLAKAAADKSCKVDHIVRNCLFSTSRLAADSLIEPIFSGAGGMLEDDEDAVKNLAFRLTDSCMKRIGVKRKRGKDGGRNPLLKMEQLELSPEIREALGLAVNQYSCRDVLDSWELAKAIPYGRAVTMMFYGPPGVGKTAAAEAVAGMLGKRILVADYSQIQNCWVGQTEKNIVKLFQKARDGDCVLFFDEADAMFYDRETASQNWEVRDVNVLLQELEKFDGVCILSTNRKVELDKALARRITLKIEFKPPTREQARAIWRKMLPAKLPLAADVDFDELCAAGLTGGEIKNVILNAARRAAARGRETKLGMADFKWALDSELGGKDTRPYGGRKLGF